MLLILLALNYLCSKMLIKKRVLTIKRFGEKSVHIFSCVIFFSSLSHADNITIQQIKYIQKLQQTTVL